MLLEGGGGGAEVPLVPGKGSDGVTEDLGDDMVAEAVGVESVALAGGVCGKLCWYKKNSISRIFRVATYGHMNFNNPISALLLAEM